MDKSKLIEKYLQLIGRPVTVHVNGEEKTVRAVIEETWRRNKSHFEDVSSKLGEYYDDYYHYIGPAGFDIRALGKEDTVEIDGALFFFLRSEAVVTGETVQYYRGVLKKAEGENDAFGTGD